MRFIEFDSWETAGESALAINPITIISMSECRSMMFGQETIIKTTDGRHTVKCSVSEVKRRIQIAEDLRRQDEAK